MELLNDFVDPPIELRQKRSDSSSRFGKTTYHDPEDGGQFKPTGLTPLERGHVYDWYRTTDGWIAIHTPYRFMDAENGRKLERIPSFAVMDPAHIPLNPKVWGNARIAKQHFRVSSDHLYLFEQLAEDEGWVLRDGRTDIHALSADIRSASEDATSLLASVNLFRETVDVADLAGEGVLLQFQEQLEGLRTSTATLLKASVDLATRVTRVFTEDKRTIEAALVTEDHDELLELYNGLRDIGWDRITRELVHRYKHCRGEEEKPDVRGPLRLELRMASAAYPVLRQLHIVDNDTIQFRVGECTVTLRPDGHEVSGDFYELLKKASQGASSGSRFSALTDDDDG